MRTLLINELEFDPARLVSVLYYAGLSISADTIFNQVNEYFEATRRPRIKRA